MESKKGKSSKHSATARRQLAELIKQKAELQEDLANLEEQIYVFEECFLRDTAARGNIVGGWKRNQSPGNVQRPITVSDRIFSNSSATSVFIAKRFCGENAVPKTANSTGANEGTTISHDGSESMKRVGQVSKTGKPFHEESINICE